MAQTSVTEFLGLKVHSVETLILSPVDPGNQAGARRGPESEKINSPHPLTVRMSPTWERQKRSDFTYQAAVGSLSCSWEGTASVVCEQG